MISTSALYKSILADPNHSVEWRIAVNGVTYNEDAIDFSLGGGDRRPRITRQMFSTGAPELGACVASRFACAIFAPSASIPRMASVVPSYRLVAGLSASEWIQKGVFYIDTRRPSAATGSLLLECYDAMLKADGENGAPYAQLTAFTSWPQSMSAVAAEIAQIMGVEIDARTMIGSGAAYMVEYPNDYTMREVLGFIAAANGGSWTMTDAGKLRLVPLTGNADSVSVGWSLTGLTNPPAFSAWSGVELYYLDEAAYSAGDSTGRVLTTDEPWATQATADALLQLLSGSSYQPFRAEGAIIDLAAELGDTVTLGGSGGPQSVSLSGHLFSMEILCDGGSRCVIAAPGEEELDHEFPYSSYVQRTLRRKVGLAVPYYGVTISREHGIEIERTDGKSLAVFNSDTFAMSALVDGVMTPRIYFDPVKGDYVFDGALGADAVFTDSLYAENGDIAELTVDSLSTSRRIRKYILSDTSDDNYIAIQEQYLRFITGSVIPNSSPVQAKNRYNESLYWQRQPVSHTADGYPTDSDGQQIYATTTQTSWPVMVYDYDEMVKAEFAFENESGTYVPILTLGAGDDHGYNKGLIHKSGTGLDIIFSALDGDEIGMRALATGYLDLVGLRKPTQLDFSAWDSGGFTETLDGGITHIFTVNFDNDGYPVRITDSVGHETEVVW